MSNNYEPAFPFACQGQTTAPEIYYGMSLRDHFAAVALSGKSHWRSLKTAEEQEACASECYSMADAMLKAREIPEKEQEQP